MPVRRNPRAQEGVAGDLVSGTSPVVVATRSPGGGVLMRAWLFWPVWSGEWGFRTVSNNDHAGRLVSLDVVEVRVGTDRNWAWR